MNNISNMFMILGNTQLIEHLCYILFFVSYSPDVYRCTSFSLFLMLDSPSVWRLHLEILLIMCPECCSFNTFPTTNLESCKNSPDAFAPTFLTHLFPEHVGDVAPTVLVMFLATAIWNYLLFQGLMPVSVCYNSAALPLSTTQSTFNTLVRPERTSNVLKWQHFLYFNEPHCF